MHCTESDIHFYYYYCYYCALLVTVCAVVPIVNSFGRSYWIFWLSHSMHFIKCLLYFFLSPFLTCLLWSLWQNCDKCRISFIYKCAFFFCVCCHHFRSSFFSFAVLHSLRSWAQCGGHWLLLLDGYLAGCKCIRARTHTHISTEKTLMHRNAKPNELVMYDEYMHALRRHWIDWRRIPWWLFQYNDPVLWNRSSITRCVENVSSTQQLVLL